MGGWWAEYFNLETGAHTERGSPISERMYTLVISGAIPQPIMRLSHKEEFAVYLPLERASLTENEHFQPKHRADILCYWRRMCSNSHDRRRGITNSIHTLPLFAQKPISPFQ